MEDFILIDDLVKESNTQTQVQVKVDGVLMEGYQIAKPLNYDPDYLSLEERKKMADLILSGKAIAVQYFCDLTEEQQESYVKGKIKEQMNVSIDDAVLYPTPKNLPEPESEN